MLKEKLTEIHTTLVIVWLFLLFAYTANIEATDHKDAIPLLPSRNSDLHVCSICKFGTIELRLDESEHDTFHSFIIENSLYFYKDETDSSNPIIWKHLKCSLRILLMNEYRIQELEKNRAPYGFIDFGNEKSIQDLNKTNEKELKGLSSFLVECFCYENDNSTLSDELQQYLNRMKETGCMFNRLLQCIAISMFASWPNLKYMFVPLVLTQIPERWSAEMKNQISSVLNDLPKHTVLNDDFDFDQIFNMNDTYFISLILHLEKIVAIHKTDKLTNLILSEKRFLPNQNLADLEVFRILFFVLLTEKLKSEIRETFLRSTLKINTFYSVRYASVGEQQDKAAVLRNKLKRLVFLTTHYPKELLDLTFRFDKWKSDLETIKKHLLTAVTDIKLFLKGKRDSVYFMTEYLYINFLDPFKSISNNPKQADLQFLKPILLQTINQSICFDPRGVYSAKAFMDFFSTSNSLHLSCISSWDWKPKVLFKYHMANYLFSQSKDNSIFIKKGFDLALNGNKYDATTFNIIMLINNAIDFSKSN